MKNNGHSAGYFLLERGTRQGDPLSAYLLEILFIQIRNNREIHGIEIDDITIKLSAHADDTYFFTLDSQFLQIILKVCENFSEYSTLQLNVKRVKRAGLDRLSGGGGGGRGRGRGGGGGVGEGLGGYQNLLTVIGLIYLQIKLSP